MRDGVFFTREEAKTIRDEEATCGLRSGYGRAWFRDQARPLYLFGCGGFACGVQNALAGLDIRGYLDNDRAKQGCVVRGLMVFAPAAEAEQIRAANALVVLSLADKKKAREAGSQCRALGLEHIDWGECWQDFDERAMLAELAEHENMARVYELFDDERSRQTLRAVVRLRTTLDIREIPVTLERQYFIDAVPMIHYRDFVDAGAHDGDTLRAFLAYFDDDFDSYHAFEPHPACRERIMMTADGDRRIHIHPSGVSDFTGAGKITDQNTSSKLSGKGDIEVEITRLDDALLDASIGIIKMDIEGEEPAALRGAETLIRHHRPALAISVYHEHSHLWRIPLWIHELGIDYRLFLRHHSRFASETVCYAVPGE